MRKKEDRTAIEEIMDNKRAVKRLEDGYDYADVKLVLVVVAIFLVAFVVIHFIMTGTLGFK